MKELRFTPSKLSKGIGLLWRGAQFTEIHKILKNKIDANLCRASFKKSGKHYFLFESCRSAIFNTLKACGITTGDEVIVCAFTCDAVTYSVHRAGGAIVYVDINDDLTMSEEDILSKITVKTKFIIVQNTLGRLGLPETAMSRIKEQGIFILEDNSLSYGSKIGDRELGSFGDVSVHSLEVSKTITLGWGGVLQVNNNNYIDMINERFSKLGTVSKIGDFQRVFQLWISLFLLKIQNNFGALLWYLFYGLRIFRKSHQVKRSDDLRTEVMGVRTRFIYHSIVNTFESKYIICNKNYSYIASLLEERNFKVLIKAKSNEFIVAPRVAFLVDVKVLEVMKIALDEFKIELGRWFDTVPPKWYGSNIINEDEKLSNAIYYSKEILNLPCHWSLSVIELSQIKDFIEYISKVIKTQKIVGRRKL